MQYNHLLQILQGRPPGERVSFPNLGGRGNGFQIWASGNSLFISFGAEGYEAVVQPNHYASTLARYNALPAGLKNRASQYSNTHWPAVPNTRVCPYLPSIWRNSHLLSNG
jgi:hypothetical protein